MLLRDMAIREGGLGRHVAKVATEGMEPVIRFRFAYRESPVSISSLALA
ncbi:MAG TPA: hypothetical protein VGL54_03905 [Solirubrobacteraceae bacterium]|jgi:hypothetical protein